jgi:shikimate kinase/3-dehydroquinate synthase
MRIFLSGLMGAGKSTVAKALAARTSLPRFDLDELIVQQMGGSVAELFRERGEAAFRALERTTLERLIAEQPNAVIALGGGVVVDRVLRRRLLEAGWVVTLDAATEELARRVGSATDRPLLSDPLANSQNSQNSEPGQNIHARLLALRSERAEAYAECHVRLDTTQLDPERCARAIWDAVAEEPIVVPLGTRSYRVHVGNNNRHTLLARILELGPVTGMLMVSDTQVGPAWARALSSELRAQGKTVTHLELAPGESAKTLESVDVIWNAALDVGIDRAGLILAVGGGVVGDLAGFAAATLLRGVRVAHIPTTLLAMVDSSIGGKTGFDTRHGKNLVGAFHQPSFVLSDVQTLGTLSHEERRAGLAEVVKSAWLDGEAAVAQLEHDADALARGDDAAILRAIRMAARLKARIVTADEREEGQRALLNLGHTLAHAIEASSGYAGIRHGEAVSIGMVAACRVGRQLGRLQPADAERAQRLLDRLGLPTGVDAYLSDRVLSFVSADKKRKGAKVNFVAPGRPGDTTLVSLGLDELHKMLRESAS